MSIDLNVKVLNVKMSIGMKGWLVLTTDGMGVGARRAQKLKSPRAERESARAEEPKELTARHAYTYS